MKDQTVEHDTVLTLHPDQHPEIACRFQLEQCLGQGGTARVYHALRLETDGGVGGTLKLFTDPAPQALERLRQVCKHLHRMKLQESLSIFIPYMVLYRDEKDQPCLFTPEDRRGITLTRYLERLAPTPRREELCQVIASVCAAALAVLQINRQGTLLLDIKPDNILLIERQDPVGGTKYLWDSVGLFDIDSLLQGDPAQADPEWLPCSPGFTAPELGGPGVAPRRCAIGPSSDVYALGATLFCALAREIYPPERGDVRSALRLGPFGKLLSSSILDQLVYLLENALQYSPYQRLRDAADFARRLDRILEGLRRETVAETDRDRQKLTRGLPRMLAHLLYRWPCHEYACDGVIRVAVLSDGNENGVLTALDALVKSCQVLGQLLQITVVMPGAEQTVRGWYGRIQARAELLEIGPAFEEYAFGEKAPAARVLWQNAEMPLTAGLHRRLQAKYWLLLMQDPERSEEMAASWPAEETPALVAYAVPNGKTLYAQTDGELKRVRLCPAAVDDVFLEQADRMAYCAHLLYERARDPHVADATVQQTFAESYNRQASLETGLAVKCRLFSAGVRWSGDIRAMAEAYREALARCPDLVRKLSWLEHRRWVLSKMVQGARKLAEEEYPLLLDGGAEEAGTHLRRDGQLYHAYLVPGSDAPRPDGWQTAQQWAKQPVDAPLPPELDELDWTGIRLHRMYAAAAAQRDFSQAEAELKRQLDRLGVWLREQGRNTEAHTLQSGFAALIQALENMQQKTEVTDAVSRWEKARRTLSDTLHQQRDKAPYVTCCESALELLRAESFCLAQSCRCLDPKALDETLVRNLPQMLGEPASGAALEPIEET